MLNLNNTLDGYLKNIEVIGNTIQDTNNLADIRSVGDKVEGQELYNISMQVDNGDGVSEVVEILSPVQLEKVGDVADRIICKDGVWGIEKNIITKLFDGSENNVTSVSLEGNKLNYRLCYSRKKVLNNITDSCELMSNKFECFVYSSSTNNVTVPSFRFIHTNTELYCTVPATEFTEQPSVQTFKEKVASYGTYIKYVTTQPQFIPLPHDQQVKLRTFAGQTNIAFLTEIPGQIKAQVPKSLGATVNTHTEQIAELHNSLERVKKLEETTVSTVETGSNFTTVNETSNGYFEGIKLEGKTLVNKINKTSWKKYGTNNTLTTHGDVARLERTVEDGNICYMALPSQDRFEVNMEYTIVLPHYKGNLNHASLYDRGSGFSLQVGMIYFNGNVGKVRIRNDKLTFSNNIELLFYTGDVVGNYLEISSNILILEGDHTNNPPEYFEGLMSVGQDVEEVSVESCFNVADIAIDGDTNFEIAHIKKGIPYSISVKRSTDIGYNLILRRNGNETILVGNSFSDFNTFTSNEDGVLFYNSHGKVTVSEIMLLPVLYSKDTMPKYKPYSHNKKPLLYFNPTTETWEKPVLREWDTIEKHSDGKYYYHKRSKEVVLNDSESITINGAFVDTKRFFVNIDNSIDRGGVICDKFNWKHIDGDYEHIYQNGVSLSVNINVNKLSSPDVQGFKQWLQANPTTVVYQLAQEEVYECTNIDLMTYSGETNYIINSGAISPKSLLKVHNNISNVVKILQEKVSLLENTFIAGLKSVLSGDMYSLATILYPEDFEQNDNIEQDIMVIPE